MKKLTLSAILLFLALAFYLVIDQDICEDHAGDIVIYFNGNIITMDESMPFASRVAVKDGKIVRVNQGRLSLLQEVICGEKLIDLKGKSMIPGFVDGHSHFSGTAITSNTGISISQPPFGNVTSITKLLKNVKDYIINMELPKGQKVFAYGYSDFQLRQKRHPNKYELDSVSTDHPILLEHYSGHLVVANSLAMEMVGIKDSSIAPDGGVYDRYQNGSLTGVFRQNARYPLTQEFDLKFQELSSSQIQQTANLYLSSGVTTAQDIFFTNEVQTYKNIGNSFPLDVNGYTFIGNDANLSKFYDEVKNYGTSWMKVKGVKFFLDGSIQAFTGLLTQPYWVPRVRKSQNLENYVYDSSRSCKTENCGENDFPNITLLKELFLKLHDEDIDILAHCNGDAAIDIFIEAVKHVRKTSKVKTDTRFVIIHAQVTREDQLDAIAQLGVIPSFFPPHIYYWGDFHYNIFLGPERANRMNPAGSAVKRNINFTLHNDSPVVIMGDTNGRNGFLQILESAINRKTSTGRVLGEDQRISPYQALKAVTVTGAWQSREHDSKGSIQIGKIADLVILSDDPLKENTENFKDLKILATVKDGKLVYGRYP